MKKTLCILLTLVLLLPMTASLAERNDHSDYSQFPLVKDGEKMTISVAVPRNDDYGRDPDKNWFWCWSEYATGVDFDVQQIMASSINEKKNLMFAADDLPDLMLGLGLTTNELMRYGMREQQLLDLTPYFQESVMPYLSQWFAAYPETKAFCTTPDGKMYTAPYVKINSDRIGSQEAIQISKTWLEKADAEIPETLDDFLALLYKIKEIDPSSTPMGGLASYHNNLSYFLNALGYLTSSENDFGYEVALRNNEVVIPAIDDTFVEYLRICNKLYTDGILDKNFFTADKLAVTAQVTEGKTALYGGYTYDVLPLPDDFHQWTSVKPLTSPWNQTKQWMDTSPYGIGGCVLSAKTEKADTILRYIDFFYSELGIFYLWEGPLVGSSDTLGMVIGMDYKDGGKYFNDVVNGDYESSLDYVLSMGLGLASAFGNRSHSITHPDTSSTMMETLQYCLSIPESQINHTMLKYDHGDNYGRICMQENITPYVVPGFPSIVYYDEAAQEQIDDISILFDSHVESEVAKFITGARDLATFDAFVTECNALGASDLLALYKQAWENYQAASAM